jgi:hypothetical protein
MLHIAAMDLFVAPTTGKTRITSGVRRCEWSVLVDAVEKVRGITAPRNNRIIDGNFLNRSCGFGAYLELILLRDPPENLFSTASVKNGG